MQTSQNRFFFSLFTYHIFHLKVYFPTYDETAVDEKHEEEKTFSLQNSRSRHSQLHDSMFSAFKMKSESTEFTHFTTLEVAGNQMWEKKFYCDCKTIKL